MKAITDAVALLPNVMGTKSLPEPPNALGATLEGIAGKLEGVVGCRACRTR